MRVLNFKLMRAGNLIFAFSLIYGFFFGVATLAAEPMKILAFGDSLTRGYGLGPDDAFPVVLERELRAAGHNVTVINSGNSGDTASAGLARIDWALFDQPDAVIIELGANDMLRGLPVSKTREDMFEIVKRFQEARLPILLTGMQASPSLGAEYKSSFDAIYTDLAQSENLSLYPFFLDGVAADASLNQDDGIHPNPEGVKIIVQRILPSVEQLIKITSSQE
jgi:acyl-CoA thioesterase-1